MVPELAEFKEMAQIRAVAHDMRITDDQVQQLPYDVYMERICYLHLQSLWQYEYNQAQVRASNQKNK